jgi:nicotinate dehydrogenase subunit B
LISNRRSLCRCPIPGPPAATTGYSRAVRVVINGETRDVAPEPGRSLLHVLREELGLLAAKPGCAEGACGACTVLLDGRPIRSCIRPIGDVDGRHVTTLEGLAGDPIQRFLARAFVEQRAMQCGFCTPGMIVSATALLREHPDPAQCDIVAGLDGNVCRCGIYPRISRAIRQAAEWRTRTGDAATPVETEEPSDPELPTSDLACSADVPVARPGSAAGTAPSPGRALRRPWDLTKPDERDYFGQLGDGLVVVLPPEEGERVNDGEGAWSTEGGAWLHVGTDGRVTAFTGKVDVGQDNRTAIAMLVAEETGAPLDAVELVMGDTDVCPFDIGTFGSRSMVDAGGILRAAAATARRWLLDRAASRWEVDAGELEIHGGIVESRDRGRSARFGELVAGERHLAFAEGDAATVDPRRWRTAGRVAARVAVADIVAASTRYTSDLTRPGMLHGRILRPPTVGATLGSVDLSRAEAMAGVEAVHDGSFVGVAAPDPILADAALAAIDAEWLETPQPSEMDLADHLRTHPVEEQGWEGAYRHETGDVDAAFRSASLRLDATYTTAYIAHVPLECRVALAEWEAWEGRDDADGGGSDGEGRVTIWTGTQRPFGVREEVAEALGISEERVRIVVAPTGGGYGGKHLGEAAIEAARLARAARRPVKVRWSRREEFNWAYFRPAAVIDVRGALDAGGRLAAWEFRNVNSGPAAIATPYAVPNQRIEYQPAASPFRQGSYRALAATANNFARESHMDELAHRAGVDPLAFRLGHLDDGRLSAVLRSAAERAGWPGRQESGRTGLGIACAIEKGGRVATSADVRIEPDGGVRLTRIVTAFECGAIVDPDNLRNQIEGATVMGIGGARFEAIHFESGRITNGSMSAYRVPRFSDVPPIEVILLDRPDEPPAGAGETPIIAVAPAIANAIFAATGRRIRSMPLLPDDWTPAS